VNNASNVSILQWTRQSLFVYITRSRDFLLKSKRRYEQKCRTR
jgi:hypothetical protein